MTNPPPTPAAVGPSGRLAPPREPRSRAPLPRALVWLVVLVAIAARARAVGNGFVNYDDPEIRAEVAARSPLEILTSPTYFAYKPVYGLSLWLDHVLFGESPLGGHVVNVLLFAAAAALATLLLDAVLRRPFVALGAGLLLAAHPVHTENVAWVAERKDSLSLLLALLAHLAHRSSRAKDARRPSFLAAALLATAGLAKGTVWTYAAVVALDERLDPARRPGALRRLAPLLVVAVAGIALDAWFGAAYGPGAVVHPATLVELAATAASVHAAYLRSLLWPGGLSVDYPIDPAGSWASVASLVGAALAVAALVGLVVGVVRRRALLAVACGLWVVGLAPVNGIWPSTSILRADRYLLVPALGLYVLVVAAIARVGRVRAAALAVVVVVVGILSARRAVVFASSDALWSDAIAKQPGSAIAWINRASDAAGRGAWGRAEGDAREGTARALALRRPELALRGRLLRSLALVQLGAAGSTSSGALLDAALLEAKAAVEAAGGLERNPYVKGDPRVLRASASTAVGVALESRARAGVGARAPAEDLADAAAAYREALAIDPSAFDARSNLGNLLATSGNDEKIREAAEVLGRAHVLRPDHEPTVLQLLTVLYRLKRDAEARLLFDEASARFGASRALRRLSIRLEAETGGDPDAADRRLEALWRAEPSDVETGALLKALRTTRAAEAIALARTTRDPAALAKATAAYDRILAIAPGDADAEIGAGDALFLAGSFRASRERYERAVAAAPASAWIRNLVARAGLLEGLEHARLGRRDEAARAVATVVRAGPPRLDLGFATLDAEIARLEPAAGVASEPLGLDSALAGHLLVAAALFVGGDEAGAESSLRLATGGFGVAPAAGRTADLYDTALLLRAIVRGRGGDAAGARNDLESVRAHRPTDPLVLHHLVLLARLEATARRRIAEGGDEPSALEAARAKEAAVLVEAERLADASPPWPGPGLLVAEMLIERGDYLGALRRLAPLAERFPADTSVRRGVAAVYQAQMLEGGDRTTLLNEARAALTEAKALDPRDPRIALDMSQLYRIAGDLETAARNALRAAAVEPIPGPASRALGAIEVERGRKALDEHELEKAAGYAKSARQADAGSAAPWILDGDVALAKGDLAKALLAYQRAREVDPSSAEAVRALAECRRRRGAAYFAWKIGHPRPAEGADDPAARAARAAWDEANAANLAMAVKELEAALRLEPDGVDADTSRERIEQLRRADPARRVHDLGVAREEFLAGETARRAERWTDAAERYRAAVDAWSDFLPAWMRIAEMAVRIGPERDVEGLRAVEVLRDLDGARAYPEPDLYAGEIWRRRALAGGADAAEAARRATDALRRFVGRARPLGEPQAANVERAERLLAELAGRR